jgi:hypothetical protein
LLSPRNGQLEDVLQAGESITIPDPATYNEGATEKAHQADRGLCRRKGEPLVWPVQQRGRAPRGWRAPGGNITGLSSIAPDLEGKRLELLREVSPKLSHVAYFNPLNPFHAA